jgi:rhodanese-related sulfurtransferase/biotin operon repressor
VNLLVNRELQDELYEQFARICKALGSARRFEILELLSHGEHSVEQLARETSMSIANTSQHLQQLKATKLVRIRRKGVEIYYRLADPTVYQLVQAVHSLANSQLAEVDRIVDELTTLRKETRQVAGDELETLLKKGKVQLVDVRPANEFEAGHIPGAMNIPLQQLEQNLGLLDQAQQVVVYCRNYYSTLADEAIQFLKSSNCDAIRLDKGFSEWKFENRPFEG